MTGPQSTVVVFASTLGERRCSGSKLSAGVKVRPLTVNACTHTTGACHRFT